MSIPFPSFALLGEPHTGKPPRVVRVRCLDIHEWLDCAGVTEVDASGYSTGVSHVLPLSRVASLKTLAAKTAAFSAPESRPPLHTQRHGDSDPFGMTDSGAANHQPEPATT